MLCIGSCTPFAVVCVHRCSVTLSVRFFISATIQSPALSCAGDPGGRGPKSTCALAYASAACPSKAVFGPEKRSFTLSQDDSDVSATQRIERIGIRTSDGSERVVY